MWPHAHWRTVHPEQLTMGGGYAPPLATATARRGVSTTKKVARHRACDGRTAQGEGRGRQPSANASRYQKEHRRRKKRSESEGEEGPSAPAHHATQRGARQESPRTHIPPTNAAARSGMQRGAKGGIRRDNGAPQRCTAARRRRRSRIRQPSKAPGGATRPGGKRLSLSPPLGATVAVAVKVVVAEAATVGKRDDGDGWSRRVAG